MIGALALLFRWLLSVFFIHAHLRHSDVEFPVSKQCDDAGCAESATPYSPTSSVARIVTSGFALSFHNAQRFSIIAFSLIFLPLRRQ